MTDCCAIAWARSSASSGVAASASLTPPIHLVHGNERRRHARRGLEEAAARQPLPRRERIGHRHQPRFDLLLLGSSRLRKILSDETICVGTGDGNDASSAGSS
jgi:hypothetical protein